MAKGHDKRYKKLFENHHLVEHLLRSFVGLDFINELDFTKMVTIDKSFIDEKYKEKESDKIYRIAYKDRNIFIYLLMEFQSTVDKNMALRFLRYLLELTETYGKEKNTGLYPAVFPLLLYNGEDEWTAKVEVRDLFDKKIPKEYIPGFKYFPILINKIPIKTLLSIHNAVSAIFLVENSSLEEYHKSIENLAELITGALPDELQSLAMWINSKLGEKGIHLTDKELEKITKPEEVVSMFASNLDKMEERLLSQGKAEGSYDKQKEIAMNMIQLGSDLIFVSKVTGLAIKELNKMIKDDVR